MHSSTLEILEILEKPEKLEAIEGSEREGYGHETKGRMAKVGREGSLGLRKGGGEGRMRGG